MNVMSAIKTAFSFIKNGLGNIFTKFLNLNFTTVLKIGTFIGSTIVSAYLGIKGLFNKIAMRRNRTNVTYADAALTCDTDPESLQHINEVRSMYTDDTFEPVYFNKNIKDSIKNRKKKNKDKLSGKEKRQFKRNFDLVTKKEKLDKIKREIDASRNVRPEFIDDELEYCPVLYRDPEVNLIAKITGISRKEAKKMKRELDSVTPGKAYQAYERDFLENSYIKGLDY